MRLFDDLRAPSFLCMCGVSACAVFCVCGAGVTVACFHLYIYGKRARTPRAYINIFVEDEKYIFRNEEYIFYC